MVESKENSNSTNISAAVASLDPEAVKLHTSILKKRQDFLDQ